MIEKNKLQITAQLQPIIRILNKSIDQRAPFEGAQIAKILSKIPFFNKHFPIQTQLFSSLCLLQQIQTFKKGQMPYQFQQQSQHENKDRAIYIIFQGSVKIESPEQEQKTLGLLDIFGQIEITFKIKQRLQKVICLQDCLLMKLSQNTFQQAFDHHNELIKCLSYLKVNDYFQNLSHMQQLKLALSMVKVSFKAGEIIKNQNQNNNFILFVIHGKIQLLVKVTNGKQYIIDNLDQMSSYGEFECMTKNIAIIKLKSSISGSYYKLEYEDVLKQGMNVLQMIKKHAINYPQIEQIQFLKQIRDTVYKQQKRIRKRLNLPIK